MSVGSLDGGMAATQDLTQTMLGGQLHKADQAAKLAGVGAEMKMNAQEMEQTQDAVAMFTGVGANLDVEA